MRNFLINAGVLCGSLFTFFLICELVVFRLILPATDIPQNAFIDGVIRLAPDQRGDMRYTDGKPVPFSINAQGWNSRHDAYQVERRPGVRRIAIIGDSYVEALQVPYDQSFADQLDRQLNANGNEVEVYRFGISGAPLSQYLYMLKNEVARYKPDLVIVLLIHNDFDESFAFKPGRYTSSFLKLKMDGAKVVKMIPPSPYKASSLELLRHSATFRYVYYQRKIRPTVLRDIILGKGKGKEKTYEANVEVDGILANWDQIEAATDYLFGFLVDSAKDQGADLILVMDANRQAIYESRSEADASGAGKLNQLASRLADARGIRFLDLDSAFRKDWLENNKRFEFPDDNHWNLRGHSEAAKAIAAFMNVSN